MPSLCRGGCCFPCAFFKQGSGSAVRLFVALPLVFLAARLAVDRSVYDVRLAMLQKLRLARQRHRVVYRMPRWVSSLSMVQQQTKGKKREREENGTEKSGRKL